MQKCEVIVFDWKGVLETDHVSLSQGFSEARARESYCACANFDASTTRRRVDASAVKDSE